MTIGRSERADNVLTLPALPLEQRQAESAVPAAADLEAMFRRVIGAVRTSAKAGNPADTAISDMLPKSHAKLLPAIAKAIAQRSNRTTKGKGAARKVPDDTKSGTVLYVHAGEGKSQTPAIAKATAQLSNRTIPNKSAARKAPDIDATLGVMLYEHAVEAVSDENTDEALVALALVAGSEAARADGVLGLAVCAAQKQDYDAARVLAFEALRLRPGHPRACCIVGRCELERGDRKAAQHYLAMAARMARRGPEFRDDLRTAQRLLLMMHIA